MCLHVLVEGCHDGAGVVGVLQSQRVAQLMHSHQEEVIPCGGGDGEVPRAPTQVSVSQSVNPLLQQTPSISFVPGPVPDTGTYTPLPSRTLHIVVDRDRETK